MRRTAFIALLAFFAAGGLMAEDFYVKKYSMRQHRLSYYGTETIAIASVTNGTVTGVVGIDWGIGPQARTPLDYEKYYTIPFRGRVSKDGNGFSFRADVDGRAFYDYVLFFSEDFDGNPALTGYVSVTPGRKKSKIIPGVYGVLALPVK